MTKHRPAPFIHAFLALAFVLSPALWKCLGAESSASPPVTGQIEVTNSQEVLQAYSKLQDQLHATQLAIEQNRQETKEAAAQNAKALSKGLQAIQEAFSAQRAQDLEATQRSSKVMLIVVGTFAAMGFLTMFMITYFQWRMSKGLAEISSALSSVLGVDPGSATAALAPVEQSNVSLLGAIEQPEQRTQELVQSHHPALKRRKWSNMPIEDRLFPAPGDSFQRRQIQSLKVAVIVGLICAAVLALLLYAMTKEKLGAG